jgi:hypothetical protein
MFPGVAASGVRHHISWDDITRATAPGFDDLSASSHGARDIEALFFNAACPGEP